MQIVLLDAYAANPGDLSWEALEALGDVVYYDRSSPEQTPARIQDAEAVLTNKALVTGEMIARAPKLTYIGVMATGYNVVDMQAAAKRGITVTNIPAYSTASVAQHTFALILELSNHVAAYGESVQRGDWTRCEDFSYLREPITELQGKTLGIIGFGRIGQAVASIAHAFGMRVIVSHKHPERDWSDQVEFVDQATCFGESDVLSLHCPLNADNKHFVCRDTLGTMKPSALLINTSRGPLVQEEDLAEALREGTIAGAGLDVLNEEPPRTGSPLFGLANCLITPHIGWATHESRARLLAQVVTNLQAFQQGKSVNVIR
jgi:glycerate dehydrogenase